MHTRWNSKSSEHPYVSMFPHRSVHAEKSLMFGRTQEPLVGQHAAPGEWRSCGRGGLTVRSDLGVAFAPDRCS